ncbi:MAG TPA: DUF885 domain-containing protein [Anaeromyxobacteraceae bacterium]|nr:DUF885 domain-containing protein [Anaeromyxobacteraceae bacterium]
MRRVAAAALLALAACASSPAPLPAALEDPGAAVRTLTREYLTAYFEAFPERATFAGWPAADDARMSDHRLRAADAWQLREDGFWTRLARVDPAALQGADLVAYELLREHLDVERRMRSCAFELWPARTLAGWHQLVPALGAMQPVGTPEARQKAIARWRALPTYVDGEVERLRAGLAAGYTAPRASVRAVLVQVDALLAEGPERSALALPAARDPDPAFGEAIRAVVGGDLRASARRYRAFLADTYLPGAREPDAITAHHDGDLCYRAALRRATSLDLTAQALHATGLAQVDAIEAEMRPIAARLAPGEPLPEVLERLRTDPRYTFRSRQAVTERASAALARARTALPRWFAATPAASLELVPVPEAIEAFAPVGMYRPGGPGRPGTYFVNTGAPERSSVADVENTAFHEGVPGHHLQIALAQERKDAQPLGAYLGQGAFVEGWALYAERLADEMGLYGGDVDRLGMLSAQAFRAARLVVDPGIHALGWSRQRAVDYLVAHTVLSREQATAEVDRYVAWPGQATSYLVGALEIRKLRAESERALGPRFDVRAFHDRVLRDGAVPLPVLRRTVEGWVRAGGT